jgi:hypothetical protein
MATLSKTKNFAIQPMASNLNTLMQDLLGGVITADPNFAFPDGNVLPNRTGFPGLLGDPGTEKALALLNRLYEEVRKHRPYAIIRACFVTISHILSTLVPLKQKG